MPGEAVAGAGSTNRSPFAHAKLAIGVTVILLFLGWRSFVQSAVYLNNLAFFAHGLAVNPPAPLPSTDWRWPWQNKVASK